MNAKADPKDFEGKWTIYDVGSATWADRLAFADQFHIGLDTNGALEFKVVRGMDTMKNSKTLRLEDPGDDEEAKPAKLVIDFPLLSRTVIVTVTKQGTGRRISLASGDEEDDKKDHGHEYAPSFFKHGGPHGVDS